MPDAKSFFDTNVLLYDPGALFVFQEHDVVIPMTVIEEIDRFKKETESLSFICNTLSRLGEPRSSE